MNYSGKKLYFLWFCARILYKIFTFEQTNSFVFFSLNQIFRTFARQLFINKNTNYESYTVQKDKKQRSD